MQRKSELAALFAILRAHWPLIAFALSALIYGVRADARQQVLEEHDAAYQRLIPVTADRLARIETRQDETNGRLDHMDNKLDQLLGRVR